MKKWISLFIAVLFALASRAQPAEDVVATACGGGQTAAGVRYDWLLGELMAELYADGISLDQGFGPAPCFTVGTYQGDVHPEIAVAAYPNPTTNFLQIEAYPIRHFSAKIFDLQGQLLLQQESENSHTALQMGLFPPGAYLLAVWSDNRLIKTFIIQKFQ
ncbi:MAG: T9SS type A sorting domain-containing protein [Saprospirales bacterium]|jgi:hypothetical protein|nr:T9SS type A sorting domain-containing protein [Saprospirales bacterium]MBK8923668.1 T9SS type A sorting domain-containing protein [Saprospirales bacterium]